MVEPGSQAPVVGGEAQQYCRGGDEGHHSSIAAAVALVLIGVPLIIVSLSSQPSDTPITQPTIPDETSATTVPEPAGLENGTIVIAAPGSEAPAADGVVVIDAEAAVGDGEGGLVLLNNGVISRITADGTEMVLLDAGDLTADYGPVSLWLYDTASIDGAMQAIVVVGYGEAFPDLFEEVWFVDLDSGATTSAYQIEAVESHITRASVAGETMVLSISFEGGAYFEYLDTSGQPIDVTGPYDGLPGGVPEFPNTIDQAVLSPNGTTFVYVEFELPLPEDTVMPVVIIVWDLTSGEEVQRIGVEFTGDTWPGRIDFDGTSVVLGTENRATNTALAPLLIASLDEGTVTEFPNAGTPSLIK